MERDRKERLHRLIVSVTSHSSSEFTSVSGGIYATDREAGMECDREVFPMRYFAVADNTDTLTGLRMAGIEGRLAHERGEARAAISEAVDDPEIGILLVTERLAALCPELTGELKQRGSRTIIVEIPDRHGTGRAPDSITGYIRESIGVKV